MDSLIVRSIFITLKTLNNWYEHSITYRFIEWIRILVVQSFFIGPIHRYAVNKSDRDYLAGSFLIGFPIRIFSVVISLFKRLFLWIANINKNSVNRKIFLFFAEPWSRPNSFTNILKTSIPCRIINWLCADFKFSFLSIFILFMSIVPDVLWSNWFIVIAAVFFVTFFILNYFLGNNSGLDKKYIFSSLLVYILFAIISFFTGFGGMDSVRVAVIMFSSIIISVLIPNLVDTKEKFENLVFVILISLVLTSLYGFLQVYMGIEINAAFVDLYAHAGLPGRLYSTMGNPNNYAKFVTMLLPFCVSFAILAKSTFKKIFLFAMISPVLIALALTFSRASYLALAGIAFVYILLIMPRLIPIGIFLAILAIPFVPQVIIDRIATVGTDTSSLYRVWIWEGSWNVIQSYWSSGIGIGPHAFNMIYRAYTRAEASNAMHAHNVFLNIWIEVGITGFIAMIIYNISLAKTGISSFFDDQTELKFYIAAGVSSLFGFIMFSMVEHVWFYPRTMLTYFLLTGMILALARIQEKSKEV